MEEKKQWQSWDIATMEAAVDDVGEWDIKQLVLCIMFLNQHC